RPDHSGVPRCFGEAFLWSAPTCRSFAARRLVRPESGVAQRINQADLDIQPSHSMHKSGEQSPSAPAYFGLPNGFGTLLFSRSMELVITLLVIGAILLLLETILPGGVAGIVGGCCLLAGVVLGYMNFGAQTGTWILFGVVAALVLGFCAWAKFFPETRLG